MANKKSSDITSTELRKLLKSKSMVIGTERAIKNLKLGRVERLFISSNCPEKVQNDIDYYASLSKAEVFKLPYPNDELGVICKKPFSISVLALLKGEK